MNLRKPCQIAKQMVIAGLKCLRCTVSAAGNETVLNMDAYPPDVAPHVMMAKAIPKEKAKATCSRLPKAALVPFKRKLAVAAIPG